MLKLSVYLGPHPLEALGDFAYVQSFFQLLDVFLVRSRVYLVFYFRLHNMING